MKKGKPGRSVPGRGQGPMVRDTLTADPMEKKVKEAVVKVFHAICADLPQEVTLEEVVEVCLDAHFPVTYGGMTREECDRLYKDYYLETTQRWAMEVLRGYF